MPSGWETLRGIDRSRLEAAAGGLNIGRRGATRRLVELGL